MREFAHIRRGGGSLAMVVFLVIAACGAGAGAGADENSVQLTAVKRLVDHTRAGGSATEVGIGTTRPLFKDDVVQLSAAGEATIAFSEFVLVRLFRDTQIRAKGEFNPAEPFAEMFVQQGTLVSETLAPEDAESLVIIEIESNAATIVATGTKFLVHVDSETQTTWVIVTEGEVEVSAAGETVRVEAGMQTWVELGKPPVEPSPASRDGVGDRFPSIEALTNGSEGDLGWLTVAPPDRDNPVIERDNPVIESFEVKPAVASEEDRIEVSVRAFGVGSSLASVVIRLDGDVVGMCETGSCDISIGTLASGIYRVDIVVVDEGGNIAEDSRTLIVDGDPPVIERPVVEPEVPDSSQTFTVNAIASDPSGVARTEIKLDGTTLGICEAESCAADVGPLPAGVHNIEILARDVVGNEASADFDVEIVAALPDLVIESFELLGPAFPSDGGLRVPVRIVIANIGSAEAGQFGYSISDMFLRPFQTGGITTSFPTVGALAPNESVDIEGTVEYSIAPVGPSELVVEVDSCAGREFPPPECDVLERDEANNTSAVRAVDLPPVADISEPTDKFDMEEQPDGSFNVLVDGTGSFDPDGGAVTHRWTVEMNSDGVVLDISSSDREVANFTRSPPCETSIYRFTLAVTDGTGNTSSDSIDISYKQICID